MKTEVPENVNFELLDCNRIKFNNYNILNLLMGANSWFDSSYVDVKFNRSPNQSKIRKLNLNLLMRLIHLWLTSRSLFRTFLIDYFRSLTFC